MPTRDEICCLVERYLAAASSHEPEAAAALFADDARQQEPVGSPARVGRDEILAFFTASNDTPFRLTRFGPVTVVGNRAAFQVHVAVDLPDGRSR